MTVEQRQLLCENRGQDETAGGTGAFARDLTVLAKDTLELRIR